MHERTFLCLTAPKRARETAQKVSSNGELQRVAPMSFARAVGETIRAGVPRAVLQPHEVRCYQVGMIRCPEPLSTKQIGILHHILPTLTHDFLRTRVVPIINQQSKVSLRALDWSVTNFCKKFGVTLLIDKELIDVHHAYLVALSHWRRRLFDPFRRRERVFFTVDEVEHETTCAQLCFLVWAEKTGVLRFCEKHIAAIEADMTETSARSRRERRENAQRRRRGLSVARRVACVIRKTQTRQFA